MKFKLALAIMGASFAILTGCSSGGGSGSDEGGITGTGYSVEGTAQKGPFLLGSTVNVTKLTNEGISTSTSLDTQTEDNLGNFKFVMNSTGPAIITVNGYHYNELTGAISDDTLTLRAVYEISDSNEQQANVNLLTHLIHGRVLELMSQGQPVNQAIQQAQQEWVTELEPVVDSEVTAEFTKLNIYDGEDASSAADNAYLLFVSAMFYQHATNLADAQNTSLEAKLVELLNTTASDFRNDGDIDAPDLLDDLRVAATELDIEAVQTNLESFSEGETGTAIPSASIGDLQNQVVILSPAEFSNINATTQVRFSLPNQTTNVTYSLLVDGEVVATKHINEATQEELDAGILNITWQPYFWGEAVSSNHSLLVQASVGNKRANSNLVTVTVDPEVRNELSLVSPVNGVSFQNQNSATLSWNAIDGATAYTVQLSKDGFSNILREQTTPTTSFEVTSLSLGDYQWRVRATNVLDQTGPWSNSRSFTIAPLDAPGNLTSNVVSNETDYDVTLNWGAVGQAQSYNIEISRDETFTTASAISTNSQATQAVETLTIGEYYWRVQAVDQNGLGGEWSEAQVLPVGVFRTQLGGSGLEYLRDASPSIQGGYLLLIATNSRDLNPNVSGYDDWLVYIDETGNIINEYFSIASGDVRFRELYESPTGYIYLVGRDNSSGQAIIIKLNQNLELIWESLYKPDNYNEYMFFSLTEWNNELYVTSGECLHKVDINNGEIGAPIVFPEINPISILHINKLLTSSTNNLVLSGVAKDSNITDYIKDLDDGAIILQLNSDFSVLSQWNNSGDRLHLNVGQITEITDQKYAVIGQSAFEGLSLSIVDRNTEYHAQEELLSEGGWYEYGSVIGKNKQGGITGLFPAYNLENFSLVSYDSHANKIFNQEFTDTYGKISHGGVINSTEDSVILAYTVNNQVVINKIASP
ncbi:hypothetical protein [Litoribrevibacter albus]|uniref:Fibronectin type-III domain-containing protein n=1 Tax=Litoribrevibacter albus TaxID=1473156 RepID=A0AA37SDC0_9GAMM|nr:hypothetical protein [Litoribrevibacter albus]GLQ32825.1 hypothetical protein GCM10007876_33040 [Litoribrevibacter albus]